jgi:hypothetical protein
MALVDTLLAAIRTVRALHLHFRGDIGELCPLLDRHQSEATCLLRATKISANNPPSNWWPGEREAGRPGVSVDIGGDIMRFVSCGGGVIGAYTAYFLARRGIDVIVIERTEVAAAASGKAGGFLALDWCAGTPLDELARRVKPAAGNSSAVRETHDCSGAVWPELHIDPAVQITGERLDDREPSSRRWICIGRPVVPDTAMDGCALSPHFKMNRTWVAVKGVTRRIRNQFKHDHPQEPRALRAHPERVDRQRQLNTFALQFRMTDGPAQLVNIGRQINRRGVLRHLQ